MRFLVVCDTLRFISVFGIGFALSLLRSYCFLLSLSLSSSFFFFFFFLGGEFFQFPAFPPPLGFKTLPFTLSHSKQVATAFCLLISMRHFASSKSSLNPDVEHFAPGLLNSPPALELPLYSYSLLCQTRNPSLSLASSSLSSFSFRMQRAQVRIARALVLGV